MCAGDASCADCNAIALDTSHLTFLARVARRLEGPDLRRAELLFRLVRVTACWRPDRLVTVAAVYDHEINPHGEGGSRVLDELCYGFVEDDADWSTLIGRTTGERAEELTAAAAAIHGHAGRDCELLGHTLATADLYAVHLVTNDEALLRSARRLVDHLRTIGRGPMADFKVINSVTLMADLLRCGAIDLDVMEAALLAEHEDVRARSMRTATRSRKLARLEEVARQSHVSLPDRDRPFDDSEIFQLFLGKVDDDHGS